MPEPRPEAADVDSWRRSAAAVLRKAHRVPAGTTDEDVLDLLTTTTYDGLRIAPLYLPGTPVVQPGAPGTPPFVRGAAAADPTGGWDVRQQHADPDPERGRAVVDADLASGVTSLWLTVAPEAIPAVLATTDLAGTGIVLDAGEQAVRAGDVLCALADDRSVPRTALTGNLGADPLGWQARTGVPADPELPAELATRCAGGLPGMRAVTVDATAYHDAGGADAEELACALATGVEYLRTMVASGLDVPTALGQMEFRYAATADQFLTIAKLRAARLLWARVAQVSGAPAAGGQRQHAVTSSAMMTGRDPWGNILRTTLACFAAAAGGAGAVTVQPFDAVLGMPSDLALRIARNTQSVLRDEASLGRVADPAGGAWYVERLTWQLARTAWDWFTTIERDGGMSVALTSGIVAERIDATWRRRAANIAHRRDPVTGVSEFPDLAEDRPQRAGRPAAVAGGLPLRRHARLFETLRDRADAHATVTGARPSVLLVPLGSPAAHHARVNFATNLFATGGIVAVVAPTDDRTRIAEVVRAAEATVACLCGTDDAYDEAAEPLAKALANAGVTRVWLAGRPGAHAGVDGYLFLGCDAVEVVGGTLDELGVPR